MHAMDDSPVHVQNWPMKREYAPVEGKARFTWPFHDTSMSELDTP